MEIFPYTLTRIGGSSINDLESLCIQSLDVNTFYSLNAKKEKKKQFIIDKLYNLIGSIDRTDDQNSLLNLKRDIFNDRIRSKDDISEILPLLPAGIEETINEYIYCDKSLANCVSKFESEYIEQTKEIREKFKTLVYEPALQKGLQFSSKSLLNRSRAYLLKKQNQFTRNDYKTELGLLKYLTRIKTKTSPFSTFTTLAITPHSRENSREALNIINKDNLDLLSSIKTTIPESIITKSHVRLNNSIFSYLQILLFNHFDIYSWLPVTLNPTIRLENEEETYLFLINHQNIESFQRIPVNPLLRQLRNMLEESGSQDLTFMELVHALSGDVDAPVKDISGYINQLINVGFLEFDLRVSGLEPDWDLKLNNVLLPLEARNVPFIKELRQTLKKIRNKAFQIERADISKRDQLMREAFDTFKMFCLRLHEAAGLPDEERMEEKELRKKRKEAEYNNRRGENGKNLDQNRGEKKEEPFIRKSSTKFRFKPETIFYEDSSLAVQMQLDSSSVEEIIHSVDELLQFMQPFDGWRPEKQKMVDYFSSQYGKGETVPLFTFYENYYRDVKKPEADKMHKHEADLEKDGESVENKEEEKMPSSDKNPNYDNEKGNRISDSPKAEPNLEQWHNNIASLLEESDCSGAVQINRKHLEHLFDQAGVGAEPLERTSFGIFIQLFSEKNDANPEDIKGVVNGVFPGFGRMLSRFLHLFDVKITEELRTWNSNLAQDSMLVENCDASCFNANIHPSLMPGEIRMPGSQNTLPEKNQVPITDLIVLERNGELYLKNRKNNKIVYTFDLGFQGFKGRSQLFQLLNRFSLAKFLLPSSLISGINKHYLSKNEKTSDVIVFPRIAYNSNIILQRKYWAVPVSKLPIPDPQESDSGYFLRLNQWRKGKNIPDEVFITIFERSNRNKSIKDKNMKIGSDDYKPQYINFNNPLLVKLFAKLVRKVPFKMKIEEMLPNSKQLFKIGGEKFVTENMIQWYHF